MVIHQAGHTNFHVSKAGNPILRFREISVATNLVVRNFCLAVLELIDPAAAQICVVGRSVVLGLWNGIAGAGCSVTGVRGRAGNVGTGRRVLASGNASANAYWRLRSSAAAHL